MSIRRVYIAMVGLLLAGMSAAAPRQYKSATLTHWVGVSVTGGEANLMPNGEDIRIKAGGFAGGHLLYELRTGGWFFNIGLGADYVATNTLLATYTDAFDRVDRTGEWLTYRYNYSDYAEQQRQVRLMIPLQAGYQFGDYVYVGVGASFRTKPLMNKIGTHTRMYTQGEYERFIEPFRDAPYYGFYPEADYTGVSTVRSAGNEVAIEAEVGTNIPLNVKKLRLRAGLFIGYDLPLGSAVDADEVIQLVDYSTVDTRPTTQTQENLQENIRFNSMLDTPIAVKEAQRLRVGLRLTVLFDVTPKPKHCMCWK